MVGDKGLSKGNAISLMLNCTSEPEIQILYEALSSGGERLHSLEVSFWGALFGDLIDKYGNPWMLHWKK